MLRTKSPVWLLLCCLVVPQLRASASPDDSARHTTEEERVAGITQPDTANPPLKRSNHSVAPKGRSSGHMYEVLYGLPVLTHVFAGKRSLDVNSADDDIRSDDGKRSWNAPPLLRYIYRKKPYRGFGKRHVDSTEDENSEVTIVDSSNTFRNHRGDVSMSLDSAIRSLALPSDKDPTLSSSNDNVGEKRSWGGAPLRWNKSNKYNGGTLSSGKRSWGGTPLRWYTYKDPSDDKVGTDNKRSWGGHPIAWGKHASSNEDHENENGAKRSWGSAPIWWKEFRSGSQHGRSKRSWGAAPMRWSKYRNRDDKAAGKRSWGAAPIISNTKQVTYSNNDVPRSKKSWGSAPIPWNSYEVHGSDASVTDGKRSWGGAPWLRSTDAGSERGTGSGSKRSWGSIPRRLGKLNLKQLFGKRDDQRHLEDLFEKEPTEIFNG